MQSEKSWTKPDPCCGGHCERQVLLLRAYRLKQKQVCSKRGEGLLFLAFLDRKAQNLGQHSAKFYLLWRTDFILVVQLYSMDILSPHYIYMGIIIIISLFFSLTNH